MELGKLGQSLGLGLPLRRVGVGDILGLELGFGGAGVEAEIGIRVGRSCGWSQGGLELLSGVKNWARGWNLGEFG